MEINDLFYTGEDPRYCLSQEQREKFHEDLMLEIKRRLDDGEFSASEIIEHLFSPESSKHYDTCDQCGDSASSYFYEF